MECQGFWNCVVTLSNIHLRGTLQTWHYSLCQGRKLSNPTVFHLTVGLGFGWNTELHNLVIHLVHRLCYEWLQAVYMKSTTLSEDETLLSSKAFKIIEHSIPRDSSQEAANTSRAAALSQAEAQGLRTTVMKKNRTLWLLHLERRIPPACNNLWVCGNCPSLSLRLVVRIETSNT